MHRDRYESSPEQGVQAPHLRLDDMYVNMIIHTQISLRDIHGYMHNQRHIDSGVQEAWGDIREGRKWRGK